MESHFTTSIKPGKSLILLTLLIFDFIISIRIHNIIIIKFSKANIPMLVILIKFVIERTNLFF
jgi:hypothetical protein